MRLIAIVAAAVVLPACVNHTELAKQSVESNVLHSSEISYRSLESYPDKVVCGDYSTRRRPKENSFLPFIYLAGKLDTFPSKQDVSVLCSKDPTKSLYGVSGINFTGENKTTLLIIRDHYTRIGAALTQYESDNFMLPRSEQGLDALLHPSEIVPRPRRFRDGGYLKELPLDPWNTPYIYTRSGLTGGVKGSYEILTLGADGAEGGIDADADVSSQYMKYLDHIEKL